MENQLGHWVLDADGWEERVNVKNTHTPSLLRAGGKMNTPAGKGMFRKNAKCGRHKI